MSEYQEKFNSSKLIGSPPGYVGYEKGGQLTEKVRRRPYSVVLLDEIEKAHTDVFNLFLPVFDEGFTTDSLGRKISFKNTIIIMTTNLGVKELQAKGNSVGFNTKSEEQSEKELKDYLKKKLQEHFSPEFLNRVDDIIAFNPLKQPDMHQIIELSLKDLKERCLENGFVLEISDEAKNFLCEKGFDAKYGARPLEKAIEKYVTDPLSTALLRKEISSGKVRMDLKSADAEELTVEHLPSEIKA
jgi:ATP-dependent Clp protease ATP-binding subunit ClpC